MNEHGRSAAELATQRLNRQLEVLVERGLTQVQIAAKAGIPAQYLSDIKRGRRPMTELIARRLSEEFDVNHQWLMGIGSDSDAAAVASISGSRVCLPLFSHPIEGEPRAHPKWDGVNVEVAGPAVGKLVLASMPYALRFNHNDAEGRLRKGDLILISQTPRDDAEIHVIRYRKKSFLARSDNVDRWIRIANGQALSVDSVVTGHCIGIIWGPLS